MKNLDTPIQYVKGVGPQKSRILAKLGIENIYDLFYYLPFRYEDRSRIEKISSLTAGTFATVKGEVKKTSLIRTKAGVSLFQLALNDGTGTIYGVWFNQPYLVKLFKAGQSIAMYGKVEKYDKLQINHPRYEILNVEKEDSIHMGRIVPIYHLTESITQRALRSLTYRAILDHTRRISDMLPTKVRAKNRLVDINFALKNIHFPTSNENLERAHKRLIFDEFFLLQVAVAKKRAALKDSTKGVSHKLDREKAASFLKGLPFELTDGQKAALQDIERDMVSTKPMNRLLQGDVGSGKTIIACYALLLSVAAGHQGAIMAPTEILAEQHYLTLNKLLMEYDLNIRLLVQGLEKGQKEKILKEISEGSVDIVIGTHALIQKGVDFKDLGLVVIDEQHKFGVAQRATLQNEEARVPDALLMTATPIPRTLALTVYGDLDISVIRELPPGRGEIITYWVSGADREKIYNFLREEVSKKRQVYIVYPRLQEAIADKVKAAEFMYEELSKRIFKDLRVGLIHGKMESKKKDQVMASFKKRKIDILVSTVVVEVGIDIPNASVMMIENAERFGLSQLHQLRGRIGRGPYTSYCILISDPENDNAKTRLSAMTEAQDGFQIAEEDLKQRGPGDIFGTRQHGLPEVRFGNIISDMEIMEIARKEAFRLVEDDPEIKKHENRFIRDNTYKRFKGRLNLARIG